MNIQKRMEELIEKESRIFENAKTIEYDIEDEHGEEVHFKSDELQDYTKYISSYHGLDYDMIVSITADGKYLPILSEAFKQDIIETPTDKKIEKIIVALEDVLLSGIQNLEDYFSTAGKVNYIDQLMKDANINKKIMFNVVNTFID